MTPELIDLATNLKVIGRAGTGVDNVDIPAATRRGIIVANAPESNSVAAAEHTLALALALFRNVPQAHASLVAGRWDRAKFKGAELYGKTLGVIGFGRIGQLVAKRAQASRWRSSPSTSSSPPSASASSGSRAPTSLEDLLGRADLVTLHVPKTPETIGLIDAEAIAAMKDGARIVNCARGELVVLDDAPRRAGVRQARRRRARRLPRGAVHRAPDLRPRRRRRHPAPRRLDRRGAGPRRRRHRRAGDRGAERRRRHQRGQHRRRAARGDGGAGAVRAALRKARPPRPGPRRRLGRPRHRRVPRPHRLPRHPPARDRRPRRDPLRPHRGAGQPGQRAADGRGAGDRAGRDEGGAAPATSPSWSPSASTAAAPTSRSPGPASARATSPTWSRPGARASTCRSPSTSPSSATPTSRG